jgi:hypothetical protein
MKLVGVLSIWSVLWIGVCEQLSDHPKLYSACSCAANMPPKGVLIAVIGGYLFFNRLIGQKLYRTTLDEKCDAESIRI